MCNGHCFNLLRLRAFLYWSLSQLTFVSGTPRKNGTTGRHQRAMPFTTGNVDDRHLRKKTHQPAEGWTTIFYNYGAPEEYELKAQYRRKARRWALCVCMGQHNKAEGGAHTHTRHKYMNIGA